MKTFLEFTSDKAVIEAELRQRDLWEEWKAIRTKTLISYDNGASTWNLYCTDFEDIPEMFFGWYSHNLKEEEHFWVRTPESMPFDVLMTYLCRLIDKNEIREFLEESSPTKLTPFQEN